MEQAGHESHLAMKAGATRLLTKEAAGIAETRR